jgi:hypothetical protein
MPFLGFILGAVICSLPYLLYSAEFPPLAVTATALVLTSAGLAIARPSDVWPSGLAVGAGIIVPIATIIAIDLQRDPTSHNLWPFEFALGLGFAMPAALLGAWLGGYLGRAMALPPLAGTAVIAAGVLAAALHVPFVLAERAAGERDARERLGALVTAQNDFRASGNGAYSCNLNDLGQTFDTPVRRYEPIRPFEGNYKTSTWAKAGDYEFMLRCEQRKVGNRFLLTAAPAVAPFGRWAYCVEADGVIRSVERRQYNKEGCSPGS